MMRLFGRRRPAPEPLLSDAEMKRLHEEIFEEPVDAEHLFAMYRAVPADVRARCEWVMDQHTLNRVRMACLPPPSFFLNYYNAESMAKFVDQVAQDRLLGLPVVIEPFAKLALRVRAS